MSAYRLTNQTSEFCGGARQANYFYDSSCRATPLPQQQQTIFDSSWRAEPLPLHLMNFDFILINNYTPPITLYI